MRQKQIHLKTTFSSRAKKEELPQVQKTCDILCTRQTFNQLSHRGSSAGQAKSLNVMQGQRHLSPDKWVTLSQYCMRKCYGRSRVCSIPTWPRCTWLRGPMAMKSSTCMEGGRLVFCFRNRKVSLPRPVACRIRMAEGEG